MSKAILDEIAQSEHNKVKVAIADIDGILRGKYIAKEKFLSAAESGFGFCNVVFGWDSADVCYDNVQYTGWHTGYPDANAKIDLGTYRRVPWDDNVPFFLADFEAPDGTPLSICPRKLLRKVIEKARSMGFEPSYGMEFEWFNFQETSQSLADKHFVNPKPLTPGMFGYSILRASANADFFRDIMDQLGAFGVPIEGLHTETGPGVYEAAIQYGEALECADRSVLFKTGLKELGLRHGIMPSFMAKWNSELPGCSGHVHQSLWSGGKNVFHGEKDPNRMSETFKHFLAGQLHCLPEILPMFAPNINSYKRLVEGVWAPTTVSWGIENRTSAFRVIPGSSKSTRLETRISGSDVNPYLSIAAALASGLYGIEKKLKLSKPATAGNADTAEGAVKLPRNLLEATERFAKSETARALFGDDFVDHFANTRIWEWRQFQTAVTDWEIRRYFEII